MADEKRERGFETFVEEVFMTTKLIWKTIEDDRVKQDEDNRSNRKTSAGDG